MIISIHKNKKINKTLIFKNNKKFNLTMNKFKKILIKIKKFKKKMKLKLNYKKDKLNKMKI